METADKKYPKNVTPQTVISQTTIFSPFEITAHWGTYSSDAYVLAIITFTDSANIDGTIYNNDLVMFSYYPDTWGMNFPYSAVALDVSSSFHTALLVYFNWLLGAADSIIRVRC